MVVPKRVLSSRFVLTNKGEEDLKAAALKARWIFGGRRDPDAGLYATSSPKARIDLGTQPNFLAVQQGWTVRYEDVSTAFVQGKQLPRSEKVYAKVVHGYPDEVLAFLIKGRGGDVRGDLVELTKTAFGLPESPRLWDLEYKDAIEELGLKELVVVPWCQACSARSSRWTFESAGFDPCGGHEVRWRLHQSGAVGSAASALEVRKAPPGNRRAEGWQKFCGRWERQSDETFEMQISMQEYIKTIPLGKGRVELQGNVPPTSTSAAPTTASSESTSTSASGGPSTASSGLTSTVYINFRGPPTSSSGSTSTSTSGGPLDNSSLVSVSEVSVESAPESMGNEGAIQLMHDRVVGADMEPELTTDERKLIGSVVGRPVKEGTTWLLGHP